MTEIRKIAVVGGGAAGMMAAVFAARQGAEVTLIEHMDACGRKLRITGKGRCNLTNDCTLEEFLPNVPTNPRFLYSALRFFSTFSGTPASVKKPLVSSVEKKRRAL